MKKYFVSALVSLMLIAGIAYGYQLLIHEEQFQLGWGQSQSFDFHISANSSEFDNPYIEMYVEDADYAGATVYINGTSIGRVCYPPGTGTYSLPFSKSLLNAPGDNTLMIRNNDDTIWYSDIYLKAEDVISTGSINGTVTDMAGNPIRWALVIAVLGETKTKAFTNREGYYEISDLEPGTYWVLCIKKGYKLGIGRSEVIAGEETTVNFNLKEKPE